MEYIMVMRGPRRWIATAPTHDLDEARCEVVTARVVHGRNARLIEAPSSHASNFLRDLDRTGSLFEAIRSNPGTMELRP